MERARRMVDVGSARGPCRAAGERGLGGALTRQGLEAARPGQAEAALGVEVTLGTLVALGTHGVDGARKEEAEVIALRNSSLP